MLEEDAEKVLIEAGILPRQMPENFTFNKVRKLLSNLAQYDVDKLRTAIEIARKLNIKGALGAVIFLKYHLGGEHSIEVDRIEDSEEGESFAVLVYPEGEMPVLTSTLSDRVESGTQLIYKPDEGLYTVVG